jgi:Cu/Ag efflux pump CusA
MNGLIDGAIGRARMVLAILVCAIIAGTATYIGLPKEADPDIQIPVVGITVPLAGVTPEDAERLLVKPIEQEIQSLEGLKTFRGYGAEGAGQLILEFELTSDIDQAVLDVKDKVDMAKRYFPADAREPIITEVNAAQFPIMVVNLFGDAPERGLNAIAEDLQDRLERDAGILEARIVGRREDVLEIVVDPVKLETYNISYQEIFQVVSSNNQLVPAGQIDTGEGSFAVKVPGLIRTAKDALDLPIRRTENSVVTLSDVQGRHRARHFQRATGPVDRDRQAFGRKHSRHGELRSGHDRRGQAELAKYSEGADHVRCIRADRGTTRPAAKLDRHRRLACDDYLCRRLGPALCPAGRYLHSVVIRDGLPVAWRIWLHDQHDGHVRHGDRRRYPG